MKTTLTLYLMGLLWSGAAVGLWVKSFPYLFVEDSNFSSVFFSLSISLCLGWAKSTFILDRVAQKMTKRAQRTTPISPKMTSFLRLVGMIVFMSGLGLGIRELPYNATVKRWAVSLIYPGIGFALLRSSFILFGIRAGQNKAQ
ncbi:MAG: hypothetical protein ACPGQS_12855 [Bradymonadia bacterium]